MGINKLKILLILIFGAISLLRCQNKKMEEKFQWLATISAPQEYPMEIYDGALRSNDFTYSFDAIWGTQNTGWGNSGGTMSVDTKEMEIPHTLEFTYYSLVEKKFYTGKWDLDKEKIEKLFQNGVINRLDGKKGNYNEFKIGLAPKGRVVLWINGEGYQKEVGVFQAHETVLNKDQAYENAQYMLQDDYAEQRLKSDVLLQKDVRERIANFGYPNIEIYNTFRNKFKWNTIIELPPGYKVENGSYLFCNGEWDDLKNLNKKPIPYAINLNISNTDGQKNGVDIIFTQDQKYRENYSLKGNNVLPVDFDLNEIFEIFSKNITPDENAELLIKVNPQNKELSISLKQNEKIFLLKKNVSKIF